MTTFTTIDLGSLAGVTGGFNCTCSVQQDPAGGDPGAGAAQPGGPPPAAAAPGGAAPGGGGALSIVNAIIGFLKSPMFSHLVNGAGEFASAFGSDGGGQPQGDGGTQQA